MKCLYCDKDKKEIRISELLFEEDKLCSKCRKEMAYHHQKFMIETMNVETFYDYDSRFKDILLQYKECYDEALKDIFLYDIEEYLKIKYWNYRILYVPSSKRKLEERGFNHLKEIYSRLGLKEVKGLRMVLDLSQEAKNYKEREKMLNNYIYEGEKIDKLLIVDDVYTSGSTIKGIYKAMQSYANSPSAVILGKT